MSETTPAAPATPSISPSISVGVPISDLSHVSQAQAAYLDATRRMLIEQQQQRQQAPIKSAVQQMQQQQPLPTTQQPVQQMTSTQKEPVSSPNNTELEDGHSCRAFRGSTRTMKSSANSVTGEESELSKLQRGRVIDRGLRNGDMAALGLTSTPFLRTPYGPLPLHLFPQQQSPNTALNHIVNSIGAGIHPAAAGLANIGQQFTQQQQQQQEEQEAIDADAAEQNEALSLVASPKKRRFTPAASNNNNKMTSSERNSSPAPGHRDNAETRPEEFPEAAQRIYTNFYVDNLLDSFYTEEEAIQAVKDSTALLKKGGFHLNQWLSSSRQMV
ncbi:hypothetical protein DAPPUDRAFT_270944 [Daphnia pulex]|uniref:Uncharacterized protein n=1 Tax=Daphnia pulex TaxID=6669 RepID=E9I1J6_DAPPU|nr:hypothetical protein DAPPUDRAFT_270944 [Daphnia pulex]|eukprot:EFX62134.1 hypothetical protein DAPPUDRAFT_270944 [Daphnia pulex]